jgi:hypothetical protein
MEREVRHIGGPFRPCIFCNMMIRDKYLERHTKANRRCSQLRLERLRIWEDELRTWEQEKVRRR